MGFTSYTIPTAPVGRGIWGLDKFARGRAIHQMLGENLPGNFPVIDKVVAGVFAAASEIASIKSIDLTATGYQVPGAVLSRLTGYVNELAGFTSRTWSGITVTSDSTTHRILVLAIEPKAATPQHLSEILHAANYAAGQGVNLVVRGIR